MSHESIKKAANEAGRRAYEKLTPNQDVVTVDAEGTIRCADCPMVLGDGHVPNNNQRAMDRGVATGRVIQDHRNRYHGDKP